MRPSLVEAFRTGHARILLASVCPVADRAAAGREARRRVRVTGMALAEAYRAVAADIVEGKPFVTTIAQHLELARNRSAEIERRLAQLEMEPGSHVPAVNVEVQRLRIKQVETERLISILNDLDLQYGYQKGRADCARHLRQELGLDRPGSSTLLALLRRMAEIWENGHALPESKTTDA